MIAQTIQRKQSKPLKVKITLPLELRAKHLIQINLRRAHVHGLTNVDTSAKLTVVISIVTHIKASDITSRRFTSFKTLRNTQRSMVLQ